MGLCCLTHARVHTWESLERVIGMSDSGWWDKGLVIDGVEAVRVIVVGDSGNQYKS